MTIRVPGKAGRRVVITGLGLVTPIGCGTGQQVFERLLAGHCGIRRLDMPGLSPQCNVTVAATIKTKSTSNDDVDPLEYDDSAFKTLDRETSKFIKYALVAANHAMKDAQLLPTVDKLVPFYPPTRCGVVIGNGGIGSLPEITQTYNTLQQSYRKVSPYFVPKILVNMAAGHVSMHYQFQGLVHSVATACAAGSHSIGDAFNFIRLGYSDMILAGGADASIDPLSIAGFARMKALCPGNSTSGFIEEDLKSSRPFDVNRSGFVMGEGAGMLVLEELESALKRKAPIIAEICGYGLSGDAYHATSPSPDGRGAMQSMSMALQDAGISASSVSYFNTHATSTPLGDQIEVQAITNLLQQEPASHPVYVSSTKGSTGHLLGAAGAVETAFTALAIQSNRIPPTLNLDTIDPALIKAEFQHVPNQAIEYDNQSAFNYALKNSFGFGGTNASLVLGRFKP